MSEITVESTSLQNRYYDYVDHSNEEQDPVTIDKLLNQMDDVFNSTARFRNKLLSKLEDVVDKTNIDPTVDDIDDVTKKISIFEQANKLLAESEKSFTTRISMRLKQKETDNNIIAGQMAVDLLKRISLAQQPVANNKNIPSLNDQLNNINFEEFDNINETELKTDPKDVSFLQQINEKE